MDAADSSRPTLWHEYLVARDNLNALVRQEARREILAWLRAPERTDAETRTAKGMLAHLTKREARRYAGRAA